MDDFREFRRSLPRILPDRQSSTLQVPLLKQVQPTGHIIHARFEATFDVESEIVTKVSITLRFKRLNKFDPTADPEKLPITDLQILPISHTGRPFYNGEWEVTARVTTAQDFFRRGYGREESVRFVLEGLGEFIHSHPERNRVPEEGYWKERTLMFKHIGPWERLSVEAFIDVVAARFAMGGGMEEMMD